MLVYWLEQTRADLPSALDWLTLSEVARANSLRFVKRRADWLLGRWTAKRAVSIFLNRPVLAEIDIVAGPSGAPEVVLAGRPAGAVISLSHSSGHAFCAVTAPGGALGCDIEEIQRHSSAFINDYLTSEERAFVRYAPATDRARLVTLLWSAKESVLKALQTGLRLDTRSVTVIPRDVEWRGDDWHPLRADWSGRIFEGWWRTGGSFVRTVVADPAPEIASITACPSDRARTQSSGAG